MGAKKKIPPEAQDAEKKHLDELLDEALLGTFPASDPPAIRQRSASDPPAICIEQVPEASPGRPAPRRRKKG